MGEVSGGGLKREGVEGGEGGEGERGERGERGRVGRKLPIPYALLPITNYPFPILFCVTKLLQVVKIEYLYSRQN